MAYVNQGTYNRDETGYSTLEIANMNFSQYRNACGAFSIAYWKWKTNGFSSKLTTADLQEVATIYNAIRFGKEADDSVKYPVFSQNEYSHPKRMLNYLRMTSAAYDFSFYSGFFHNNPIPDPDIHNLVEDFGEDSIQGNLSELLPGQAAILILLNRMQGNLHYVLVYHENGQLMVIDPVDGIPASINPLDQNRPGLIYKGYEPSIQIGSMHNTGAAILIKNKLK